MKKLYVVSFLVFFYISNLLSIEVPDFTQQQLVNKIVFIVRQDYIDKFYPALNTYNNIIEDLNQSYEKKDISEYLKTEILKYRVITQFINKRISEFLKNDLNKKGYTLEDIEPNYIRNNPSDEKLLETYEKDLKTSFLHITALLADNILDKFNILQLTKRAILPGAAKFFINEDTVSVLNEYLRFCLSFGLFLISPKELSTLKKYVFLNQMEDKIKKFKKEELRIANVEESVVDTLLRYVEQALKQIKEQSKELEVGVKKIIPLFELSLISLEKQYKKV